MDQHEDPRNDSARDSRRRHSGDDDLLQGGSGEQGSPDGPTVDQAIDDPLNGGSGETEPAADDNEPPIKRHDGQVYGG
jgi:hypothetical protein